jgi:15-cis-phytoene synthase/lycopene beta-cyclase
VETCFPPDTHAGLLSLPVSRLSAAPLYDLLKGFEMDLCFGADDGSVSRWPIDSQEDLMLYGLRVAGTVAELCLDLVFHHARAKHSPSQRQRLVLAGRNMGIALQLVNIARDVAVDARLERVYLPRTWLQEAGLTHNDILQRPTGAQVEQLRDRLLRTAESIYSDARTAIEELPGNGRRGMRVAVESYMEIGRVLQEKAYRMKAGKASVPLLRRLRVAWLAALKP